MVEIKKPQSEARPTIQVLSLFPHRFLKNVEGDKLRKFMAKLSNLSINILLVQLIQGLLRYAKLKKRLKLKKNLVKGDSIEVTHRYSDSRGSKVVENKDDPEQSLFLMQLGWISLKNLYFTLV